MIKQGSIVQPIAAVLDLNTDIEKDDSPSANPVTNQGFNLIPGLLADPKGMPEEYLTTFLPGKFDLLFRLEIPRPFA